MPSFRSKKGKRGKRVSYPIASRKLTVLPQQQSSGSGLILPKFGIPNEEIKRHPLGSYAIKEELIWFRGGKWIEKRKRPLYHIVRITGHIDDDRGQYGYGGLHYDLPPLETHTDKDKAIARVELLNRIRRS